MIHPLRSSPKFKYLLIGVVFLSLASYYPWIKTFSAYRTVRTFSEQVTSGMPIQGLEEKAGELGLNVMSLNRPTSGRIVTWAGWSFARWFCEVEHEDWKCVRLKRLFFR